MVQKLPTAPRKYQSLIALSTLLEDNLQKKFVLR